VIKSTSAIIHRSRINCELSNTIRIILLDYHTLVRQGLRLLIEARPGMKVVGEAGAYTHALELVKMTPADIILLELNLDGCMNPEIIPQLLSIANGSRIILVTGVRESEIFHQAVRLGAMGVVRKDETSSILLKAIEKVHAGEVWIDRTMMADVLTQLWRNRNGEPVDPEAARIALLTDREREVTRLIGEGMKNKEIASRLSISEVTVRHHLTSIYNKLDVNDRLELTIFAYRTGLAVLPL
jgi:two-component system, NarL family, nitrate/nitrite response regulator NarL